MDRAEVERVLQRFVETPRCDWHMIAEEEKPEVLCEVKRLAHGMAVQYAERDQQREPELLARMTRLEARLIKLEKESKS